MTDRVESVRTSYSDRATEYIEALGSIEHAAAPDLALVERWARNIKGPVLDVGCGPGQWTHYLVGLGIDTEGVDPVSEFIENARETYPGVRYRIGKAESLGVDDASLGGILAWYSLIHTAPRADQYHAHRICAGHPPGRWPRTRLLHWPEVGTIRTRDHHGVLLANRPLDRQSGSGRLHRHAHRDTHRPHHPAAWRNSRDTRIKKHRIGSESKEAQTRTELLLRPHGVPNSWSY
ncbi:class I SAM-dependent methyltransferase [Brevibacterium paucivorans]|uniref:class I SAM-dependent methyltransferase n=1 Tax=Brevibacterium paucivorans TaxID=170994 RepID=UPI00321A3227